MFDKAASRRNGATEARSAEVGSLLERIPGDKLYLTDFTLHSIGIILTKLAHASTFNEFVEDVLINGSAHLVGLQPEDMSRVTETAKTHRLDFDDAYQYVNADKLGLTLVSFDSDFVGRLIEDCHRPRSSPMRLVSSRRVDLANPFCCGALQ